MWFRQNPFGIFADLPEKPRFGWALLVIGTALVGGRFEWERVAPDSFWTVSMVCFRWFHWLFRQPSFDLLGGLVVVTGLTCVTFGGFILLNCAFSWIAGR